MCVWGKNHMKPRSKMHFASLSFPSAFQVYQTQQIVLLPPKLDAQTGRLLHSPQAHEDVSWH